jgi:hypothetical protein
MTFTKPLSEHQIQATFFKWVRLQENTYPCLKLMFAVPNAGKRGYKTSAMLVSEGLRKGVLDVIFPVGRSGFNGLGIEFKKPGGKLTPEQEEFADGLTGEGWLVVVMTDSQGAINLVRNYLGMKNG